MIFRGSDVASRDASGYVVVYACSDLCKLDWASDKVIWEAIDLFLQLRDTMAVGVFGRLEKLGLSTIFRVACWQTWNYELIGIQPRS